MRGTKNGNADGVRAETANTFRNKGGISAY